MNEEISFGRIVKEHRRALDLTQAELARRVACATITVRKIEADALRPSQQIAERLAMALSIPLDDRARFVRLARMALRDTPEPSPLPTPPPTPEEIGGEDLSGRAIRGYNLGERIGAGGFGAVYRAVQPLIEREVAIKIILPQYADHPDFIRRFEAEAQLVARLEHPYIVPLYDYWREPGVAYLVMRLLRGGSLRDALKEGPLALETVAVLLEQIGAALHAAHRVGVIHRDLKPANVLLDEDGNGYLADFGIAKNLSDPDLEDLTQAGAMVGSPAYTSPEQIRSELVKPQADIYCLGVLLYELLAGRKPFQGPTPVDYIMQHLNEPLPSLDAHPVLDGVIQRATAKDPLGRYPDVPSLLADFRQVLTGDSSVAVAVDAVPYRVTVVDEELENPYKGLRPFGEADADDFFGREMLVQELLGRMAEVGDPAAGSRRDLARFLAVVGPSGSGKSSVVKAGLIPALRHGGLPGSENWYIVDLMPGAHPLEELEAALLRIAVNPPESLLAQLREDERGLLRAVRRVLPADPNVELVLVIDQFEEVFTQVADEEARAHLLDSLVTAVMDERSRVRVVVTLRADFTGRALEYVDFGELVRQQTSFVLPLTPDELEQAIVGPAAGAGLAVEPGLVATMVQDVGDQPGMLPLLQYALTELFERREKRTLTLAAYQESGGVTGALGRRAEELYVGLEDPAREAARQLFLRLVTLGEGVEDTRRRVLRTELETLEVSETSRVLDVVIDQYGRYRLLAFDHDPLTRGPTVEVAHEALLREWGRLRGWLDESRADVRMQRLLAAATAEWEGAGREPSYLLQGARLAQFEGWAEGSAVALTQDERAYLEASVAERQARQAVEEARLQRELETAQKLAETERHRAEEQTRFAARVRQWAIYLAMALVVAVIAAAIALNTSSRNADLAVQNADIASTARAERAAAEMAQAQEAAQRATAQAAQAVAEAEAQARATQQAIAEDEAEARATQQAIAEGQTRLAISRELASAAIASLDEDPERSALLALEVLSAAETLEASNALRRALPEMRVLRTLPVPVFAQSVAFSPDGTLLAAGHWGEPGGVIVWDAASGEELFTLEHPASGETRVAFSPDGTWLFESTETDLYGWEISTTDTGAITATNPFSLSGYMANASSWFNIGVSSMSFNPDETRIAVAHWKGAPTVFDLASMAEVLQLEGHTFNCRDVDYSPDGTLLATAGDDLAVKVWDAETGRELLNLAGHTSPIFGVEFSPDGTRLVTAEGSGVMIVWDPSTGEKLLTVNTDMGDLFQVRFTPDGRSLLTPMQDSTVRVWDAESGDLLLTYAGHTAAVKDAVTSPDGGQLASASTDGTVKMWTTGPVGELHTLSLGPAATPWAMAAYSPDGRQLATGNQAGPASVWDPVAGEWLFSLPEVDEGAGTWKPAYSPDGTHLAVAAANGPVHIYDLASRELMQTLSGHVGPVIDLAYSPDGRRLATAGFDGLGAVWDLASGQAMTLTHDETFLWGIAFSPDGSRVATVSPMNELVAEEIGVFEWDAATGEKLRMFPVETLALYSVRYSPDGELLAAGIQEGDILVWDTSSGALVRTLTGHTGIVPGLAFSSDGKRLASRSNDNTPKVWDMTTGQEIATLVGHASAPWGVAFSPDGAHVATSSPDGTVRIYVLDTDELVALAQSRVTRSLTTEECQKYLHVEECPQRP